MKIKDTDIYEHSVKNAPDALKAEGETSTRDIKHIFDRLPEFIAAKFNEFVDYVEANILTEEEMVRYVEAFAFNLQKGSMNAAIYDRNGNGVVDNAEKLDGHEAGYFATLSEVTAAQLTADKAMPKTGGTFTGNVTVNEANRGGAYVRNIFVKDSDDNANVSTNSIKMVRKGG